jgi:hypothetical protein
MNTAPLNKWLLADPKEKQMHARSPLHVDLILAKSKQMMVDLCDPEDVNPVTAAAWLTGIEPDAITEVRAEKEAHRYCWLIVVTLDSGQDLEFDVPDVELLDMPRSEMAALAVLLPADQLPMGEVDGVVHR